MFWDLVYPFILQVVCPAVVCTGPNALVLQLPTDICWRACDTVTKHPIPPLTTCCCITPTESQPYIHSGPYLQLPPQKNPFAHAHCGSEAEILNILKLSTLKDWDGGPLTRKFANGCRALLEGQGCFTQRILLRDIQLVIRSGYFYKSILQLYFESEFEVPVLYTEISFKL